MTNISFIFRNTRLFRSLRKEFYAFLILISCSLGTYAQQTLHGTVVDRNNEPLPGVSVAILSTTEGTATDIDGELNFTTDQSLPLTLSISFLGFRTQEIDVYDASEGIHVVLSEEANILGEIVVTGVAQGT